MKKFLMLFAILFIQQSCFSMQNEEESLASRPHERIIEAMNSSDAESLRGLAEEYAQTCIVCNNPVNVLQATPLILSTSKNNKKITAQIKTLQDLVQTEEFLSDVEVKDQELIQFSFHEDCESQAKKLFFENPKLSNCVKALIATGFCLGVSTVFGVGMILFMSIQKSCEGEAGYACHPC